MNLLVKMYSYSLYTSIYKQMFIIIICCSTCKRFIKYIFYFVLFNSNQSITFETEFSVQHFLSQFPSLKGIIYAFKNLYLSSDTSKQFYSERNNLARFILSPSKLEAITCRPRRRLSVPRTTLLLNVPSLGAVQPSLHSHNSLRQIKVISCLVSRRGICIMSRNISQRERE